MITLITVSGTTNELTFMEIHPKRASVMLLKEAV
jgi:hypothetical protein